MSLKYEPASEPSEAGRSFQRRAFPSTLKRAHQSRGGPIPRRAFAGSGFRVPGPGSRGPGSGFRVSGVRVSGIRVPGSRVRDLQRIPAWRIEVLYSSSSGTCRYLGVWVSGFRFRVSAFRVSGFGIRVWDLWCSVEAESYWLRVGL